MFHHRAARQGLLIAFGIIAAVMAIVGLFVFYPHH